MSTYVANNVEILRLSRRPDSVGMVIPPEAFVTFPNTIKVLYGDPNTEYKAGIATLRKQGLVIYADFVLKSKMKDEAKALRMISKLYPAVSFTVEDAVEHTVLKLKITELFLTPYTNDDLTIENIGNRITKLRHKKELH